MSLDDPEPERGTTKRAPPTFTTIPLELRYNIFELLLCSPHTITFALSQPCRGPVLPLTQSCTQLRDEIDTFARYNKALNPYKIKSNRNFGWLIHSNVTVLRTLPWFPRPLKHTLERRDLKISNGDTYGLESIPPFEDLTVFKEELERVGKWAERLLEEQAQMALEKKSLEEKRSLWRKLRGHGAAKKEKKAIGEMRKRIQMELRVSKHSWEDLEISPLVEKMMEIIVTREGPEKMHMWSCLGLLYLLGY